MAKDKSIQSKAHDPEKYAKLVFNIFMLVFGFILACVVLFVIMRLLFGLMTMMPWLDYVFAVMLVIIPTALFVTAYGIFIKRTLRFPVKSVKVITIIPMALIIAAWMVIFILDLVQFFQSHRLDIDAYYSYHKSVLIPSVAIIFILGLIQAWSSPSEPDWLDRQRSE
jgi:hypothetical protein